MEIDRTTTSRRVKHGLSLAALVVAIAMALVPWVRNREYISDFYDYGLVMAGVERIKAGERPYRDFVTPIQTGVFLFNGLSENLAGSTYQGMTRGNAVMIVLSVGVLAWVLARRLPLAIAACLAGALTCATFSQHTIIWYNGVSVLLLALVAWSGAHAPVLRREHAGWNIALVLALVLGGLSKVSFQLIAVALAMGWALRSGLLREAGWQRVVVTIGCVLVSGLILPMAIEIAWTGAAFSTWWYNVVALPASGRSGDLSTILQADFYLRHLHNYYGPLVMPAVGLFGAVATVGVLVVGLWRMPAGRPRLDYVLLPAAVLVAAGAGLALLATNHEIAYLSLAAWLILLIGVWLGFGLPTRGLLFHAGLFGPVMLLGAVAWQAAWSGQRALWSRNLSSPRSAYVTVDGSDPEFGYLRGTRIPPEVAASLVRLSVWRAGLEENDRRKIFYGAGTEWLERVWPAPKVPHLPLWFALGVSYGKQEVELLTWELQYGGTFRHMIQAVPWKVWLGDHHDTVFAQADLHTIGQAFEVYHMKAISAMPLDFIARHGGNVDLNVLTSTLKTQKASGGRHFLGTASGEGEMTLIAPSYRLKGELVLKRRGDDTARTLHADFAIARLSDDEGPIPVWGQRIELPAGQDEIFVPYEVDGAGLPLRFTVTVAPEHRGRLYAGWRNPRLLHSFEHSDHPPRFFADALEESVLDEAAMAALLPAGWRPSKVVARGGRLTPAGYTLSPGGELWLRADGGISRIEGVATVAPGASLPADPVVRAFFYKGGRLDVTSQSGLNGTDRVAFQVWASEPGGWLVLTLDRNQNGAPVVVKVTDLTRAGE